MAPVAWNLRFLSGEFASGDRKDRHIATVLAGIRNSHASPPLQKEAILPEDLIAMLETLDLGLRDRAMLLLGFAGAWVVPKSSASTLPGITRRTAAAGSTFSTKVFW
ncbi:hypothetical protein GCM10010869_02510 [Mesorhizobium tianshanense]|uniref:Uncharacterized protein n=1 Tax=Mesorhizobium tianshanense TaxID=39844 RepID=A0A562PC67_9HYPH|nr:hypothetical protein IQ26_00936 [Mesorhizobium tianshanense]GLS34663.1 hypothetical protein GCM10010869_02510 [Mesorhizobium tianshanense]